MDWPLRDLFLGFAERLREAAIERHRAEVLVWAVLAPWQKQKSKPPAPPRILFK
ncbi:MAG: hypothetical protein ABSE45_15035 [Candidatus Acidiferrales bacterium]|jgi:hypothetical protein